MTPERFKRIREEELKLSQADLADCMGVSRETVTRWENGTRELTPMAKKLLAYIRISLKPASEIPD